MKRFLCLAALLGLTAASPAPVTVETATGDWSYLPSLSVRGYDHLNLKMMAKLHEIASHGQCTLPGYSEGKLDLRLSFAVQYDPKGTLQRVVLPKLNCPEAESVVGGTVLEMLQGGDYRPTGANEDGWYKGDLSFTFAD
ncbi:MAG TPA: hypothetical protein VF757_11670 [Sphingomicrobium sp.]